MVLHDTRLSTKVCMPPFSLGNAKVKRAQSAAATCAEEWDSEFRDGPGEGVVIRQARGGR